MIELTFSCHINELIQPITMPLFSNVKNCCCSNCEMRSIVNLMILIVMRLTNTEWICCPFRVRICGQLHCNVIWMTEPEEKIKHESNIKAKRNGNKIYARCIALKTNEHRALTERLWCHWILESFRIQSINIVNRETCVQMRIPLYVSIFLLWKQVQTVCIWAIYCDD